MRIPSERRLIEAFGDDQGRACYAVLKGRVSPLDYARTAAWVSQCYHDPSIAEQRMHACDQILETCGLEGITFDGDVYPSFEYCNSGDTYDTTLIRDLDSDRVFIGSWGDVVEAHEAEVAEAEDDNDNGLDC